MPERLEVHFFELRAARTGWKVQRDRHARLERAEDNIVHSLIAGEANVCHSYQLFQCRCHIVLVVVKRTGLGFELLSLFVDRTRVSFHASHFLPPLLVSHH